MIENIGGAAGILGGKTCAQATGDGYTICVIYHSTMSFNPLLFSTLPYNPPIPEDLRRVGQVAGVGGVYDGRTPTVSSDGIRIHRIG